MRLGALLQRSGRIKISKFGRQYGLKIEIGCHTYHNFALCLIWNPKMELLLLRIQHTNGTKYITANHFIPMSIAMLFSVSESFDIETVTKHCEKISPLQLGAGMVSHMVVLLQFQQWEDHNKHLVIGIANNTTLTLHPGQNRFDWCDSMTIKTTNYKPADVVDSPFISSTRPDNSLTMSYEFRNKTRKFHAIELISFAIIEFIWRKDSNTHHNTFNPVERPARVHIITFRFVRSNFVFCALRLRSIDLDGRRPIVHLLVAHSHDAQLEKRARNFNGVLVIEIVSWVAHDRRCKWKSFPLVFAFVVCPRFQKECNLRLAAPKNLANRCATCDIYTIHYVLCTRKKCTIFHFDFYKVMYIEKNLEVQIIPHYGIPVVNMMAIMHIFSCCTRHEHYMHISKSHSKIHSM